MVDEAGKKRWEDYWARRDKCKAGEHDERCPDKTCPVKKARTPEEIAEVQRQRAIDLTASGVPFASGHDPRRPGPDNFRGLAAGGWMSPRVVTPIAEAICERLLSDPNCEYLREPRYEFALWSLCWTEAQLFLVRARQDELTPDAGEAEIETETETITQIDRRKRRRVTRKERRESISRSADMLERRAGRLRTELGLTPASAARIGADMARGQFDLAAFLAEYQKKQAELERRQRELESGTDDNGAGLRAIPS